MPEGEGNVTKGIVMYQLAAFDMDGTLLNSKKEMSAKTVDAISRALKAGKKVALSTGRCVAELRPYKKELSQIQYGILESASLLYDFFEEKVISKDFIDPELVPLVMKAIDGTDLMTFAMSDGECHVKQSLMENLDGYHMGAYRNLYESCATMLEDDRDFILHAGRTFEKINLYHLREADRARTRSRLTELLEQVGGNLELTDAETTSLEITPPGLNKGAGLIQLCKMLNVPIEEAIAVGDADNVISMLEVAGLGVAMGNANERVKASANVLVSDCDHEGCVEVIDHYLLEEA